MLLLFILVLIILILILLILLLRIYITVHYSFKDYEQQLKVSISVYKLKLIDRNIPLNELENQSIIKDFDFISSTDHAESYIKTLRKVTSALNTILNKTELHQLSWSTLIGTGEASSTGVVSGVLWGIKGSLIGYFAEKFILACDPEVQVNPKFQQEDIQTNLDCMVSIRIGKAMQALIKVKKTFNK